METTQPNANKSSCTSTTKVVYYYDMLTMMVDRNRLGRQCSGSIIIKFVNNKDSF